MGSVNKVSVSLAPKDFVDDKGNRPQSITEWLNTEIKPDKKTSAEIHSLDIHCVMGIGSVKETLNTWSSEHDIGYQELSRYACLIASERMSKTEEVANVIGAWEGYRALAKEQKEAIRRACGNPLGKLANGYEPLMRDSYHVWCWEDSNKQAIFGILKKMGMGVRIINPFLADALSDLPDLAELANDLREEYHQGLRHLRIVNATINSMTEEFRREKPIW